MRSLVSVKEVIKKKKITISVPDSLAVRLSNFEKRTSKHKHLDVHLEEAIAEQINKLLDRAEGELDEFEVNSGDAK